MVIWNLDNFIQTNQKISGKRSRITAWAFSYLVSWAVQSLILQQEKSPTLFYALKSKKRKNISPFGTWANQKKNSNYQLKKRKKIKEQVNKYIEEMMRIFDNAPQNLPKEMQEKIDGMRKVANELKEMNNK